MFSLWCGVVWSCVTLRWLNIKKIFFKESLHKIKIILNQNKNYFDPKSFTKGLFFPSSFSKIFDMNRLIIAVTLNLKLYVSAAPR